MCLLRVTLNVECNICSCDSSLLGILIKEECCIRLNVCLVVASDLTTFNSYLSTSSSNVNNVQTCEVRVLNGNNCISCRTCKVYSVVSSSSSNILNSYVGSTIDNVDCTLTACYDGQVLNLNTISTVNIDSTSSS